MITCSNNGTERVGQTPVSFAVAPPFIAQSTFRGWQRGRFLPTKEAVFWESLTVVLPMMVVPTVRGREHAKLSG